jgi:hypothetical protein
LTVQRSGTTATEASIGYVTKGGYRGDGSTDSTTPGDDFATASGRLSFPAGVTTRTVSLTVLDDPAVEGSESLMLRLNEPSPGALLGTPRTIEIRIRPSDQRPDLLIGPRPGGQTYDTPPSGFVGNNIYNTTAERQTLVKTGPPGQTRPFFVRLYNHGNWPGTSFTLQASPDPAHAQVRYLHGDTDITHALRTPAGYRIYGPSREEWEYDQWRSIRIQVTVGPRAALGSRQAATLTATWTGDRIRSDTVKAAVRVTR